jgi:FtsP/CotA-like multicopper oxidase with cupredoxin domain
VAGGRATSDASIPNIVEFVPTSAWTPPDPDYHGWKETVRMIPGQITRVIMKFSLPKVPFPVPRSSRTGLRNGHEYVWHCHTQEHEEHNTMPPWSFSPRGLGREMEGDEPLP